MPPELDLLDGTDVATAPPTTRPLLTIAIPTFNRAGQLETLLDVLEPQLSGRSEVELFVSDNASDDRTPEVIAAAASRFALAGARLRAHRQPRNVGSDANFAFCFAQANGQFFWMCGDDDLIVPNAVAEVLALLQDSEGGPADLDLIYATSYGFREDYRAERSEDPLGRHVHTLRDARTVALVVNIMFTFISGIIVNRDRLQRVARETPDRFVGTNLVQLSWSLPLLLDHRRSAVLWTRPVAARIGDAHGYSLGHVFGHQLAAVMDRLLPGRPDLSGPILNLTLRRWLPSVAVEFRSHERDSLQLGQAAAELRETFGRNPRFWLFTYPAFKLPLPAARLYTKAVAAAGKLLYMAQVPGFWRKQS